MTTRNIIIISVLALATSFAIGRYLTPERVKTEIKTVTVEKVVVEVKRVVTTVKEKPDGTKETVIVEDSKTNTNENSQTVDSKHEETKSKNKLIVAAMAGMNIPVDGQLIYGLEVSKNLLGPIRMGIFGMTNKTAGITLGLEL